MWIKQDQMESVQSRDQINKEINVETEVEGETRRELTEESLNKQEKWRQ